MVDRVYDQRIILCDQGMCMRMTKEVTGNQFIYHSLVRLHTVLRLHSVLYFRFFTVLWSNEDGC